MGIAPSPSQLLCSIKTNRTCMPVAQALLCVEERVREKFIIKREKFRIEREREKFIDFCVDLMC